VDPESAVRSLSLDEELPPFLAVPDRLPLPEDELEELGMRQEETIDRVGVPVEVRHGGRVGVSRVQHQHVRLGQNLRPHRSKQGPALLQPAGNKRTDRVFTIVVGDAFGSGIDLGPAEQVVVRYRSRIVRQIAQRNEHGQSSF